MIDKNNLNLTTKITTLEQRAKTSPTLHPQHLPQHLCSMSCIGWTTGTKHSKSRLCLTFGITRFAQKLYQIGASASSAWALPYFCGNKSCPKIIPNLDPIWQCSKSVSSKAGSQKALESLRIEEDFGRLEHTRLGDRHHMYIYIHVNTHVHTHWR